MMIFLALLVLIRADFSIHHRNNISNAQGNFRDLVNPGSTKMLSINSINPIYRQIDIDEYHATAYEFFDKYWQLNIRPNNHQIQDNAWHIKDRSNNINWACSELAIVNEHSPMVYLDTRENANTMNWNVNIFMILCTAIIDLPIKGTLVPQGESIWYGFIDYFDPNEDMSVGFNPNTRQGPHWEHWPIWSIKPTQTYPNQEGRYLYEFNSQAWSPSTLEYPDGLICNYISRVFIDGRDNDEHNEQDDSMYCLEAPIQDDSTIRVSEGKFVTIL